jgi:hypothetical protein
MRERERAEKGGCRGPSFHPLSLRAFGWSGLAVPACYAEPSPYHSSMDYSIIKDCAESQERI